jgi:hypothetical protein
VRGEIGMAPAAVSATVGDVGPEAGLEESIEKQGPLAVVGEVGFDTALLGQGPLRLPKGSYRESNCLFL